MMRHPIPVLIYGVAIGPDEEITPDDLPEGSTLTPFIGPGMEAAKAATGSYDGMVAAAIMDAVGLDTIAERVVKQVLERTKPGKVAFIQYMSTVERVMAFVQAWDEATRN